jgi:urease accessory protein
MYSIEHRIPATEPIADRLVAPFDLRQKSRFRATLASGAEAGVFLERGTVLRHGDCLKTDCGLVIRVEAAPELVLTVHSDSPAALLRAAYHLGNRHVQLEVGADWLRLGFDPVLRDMLVGLGLQVLEQQAPFEPEAGAYPGAHPGGQGHHHGHGDHSHQHLNR